MISAWLTKAATPMLTLGLVAVAVAGIGLATAYCDRQTAEAYERTINDRVATAIAGRDAVWEGKIEKVNAATEKRAADQIRSALQIQAEAVERIQSAEQQLAELKVQNEALPVSGDCGLGVDRGRLLPN